MGKAHPSSHGRSYIPNTMFLWLIIQLLMTIKTAHKLLSLNLRNCKGKPNIWILPPLLQKNKYGRSQLLLTYHLPLQQEIWLVFNSTSNLIGETYISHWSTHWSTHWTAHNIPDAPTKRYFFTKKITQLFTRKVWGLCSPWSSILRPPKHRLMFFISILSAKEVICPF